MIRSLRHFSVLSCLVAVPALAAGCGSSSDTASTSPGAGGSGGGAGAGGASGVMFSLPQFVRGAAVVNPESFPVAPVVIVPSKDLAEIEVTLDGKPVVATKDGQRFLAPIDVAMLDKGEYALEVKGGGGSTKAVLRSFPGGVQHTRYVEVGFSICSTLLADTKNDQLLLAHLDKHDDTKHAFLSRLDGAGRKVGDDLVLDDPMHAADRVNVALGDGTLGVVYQFKKTVQGNPSVGLQFKVISAADGAEIVPGFDLTGDSPGIPGGQADVAWDGAGFGVTWQELDLSKGVEKHVVFQRIDAKTGAKSAKAVVGVSEAKGPDGEDGKIDDLQRSAIACNADRCAVLYTKRVYNNLAALSTAKVHVAVVGIDGTVQSNVALKKNDWDIQEDYAVGRAGEGFVVSFVGTDTASAVLDPPVDRQHVWFGQLDAAGALVGQLAKVDDGSVGQRYNSSVAAHPDGAAILWEDQREKEKDLLNGQNRLSVNFLKGGKLERAYLALPRSRIVLEPYATAVPAGSNYLFAWIDERQGGTVLDPKGEVYFDTYWRY